ncbi:DUF4191 domain-containing protein [Humidisolicoccus flavus]|uniref:DUF4191 domain-containing protein n=1 Tax=Humidisolicoccus flavus TaxID=3111414 RepID=UPI003245BED6
MARKEKKNKGPGRLKTTWQVFQMTRKEDPAALWLMIGGFLLPIVIAVLLAIFVSGADILFTILWVISGVLVGLMVALSILTRRAEKVAYRQIEGRQGAVGAILKDGLRGSWQTSEMPVAVSGKTRDAVYRAVGRAGVILIGEGPKSRVTKLVTDEQRKVKRIVPNVPIHIIWVGPDEEAIRLANLTKSMKKFKKTLTRPEVAAVSNRLTSLGGMAVPIPKGVDPTKLRAGKPR